MYSRSNIWPVLWPNVHLLSDQPLEQCCGASALGRFLAVRFAVLMIYARTNDVCAVSFAPPFFSWCPVFSLHSSYVNTFLRVSLKHQNLIVWRCSVNNASHKAILWFKKTLNIPHLDYFYDSFMSFLELESYYSLIPHPSPVVFHVEWINFLYFWVNFSFDIALAKMFSFITYSFTWGHLDKSHCL